LRKLLFIFTWVFLESAWADSAPIRLTNSLPIQEGIGFSTPKSATINELKTITYEVNTRLESHASDSGSTSEALIIDGEVYSATLNIDWGFAENWQASIGLKALSNSSGNFDSAIDAWHEFFGLDDGDRVLQVRDQLRFSYSSPRENVILNRSNSSLGDVHLGLSRRLFPNSNNKFAIHGELTLPNGKNTQALGSDKSDFGLSLAASNFGSSLGWHANLGMLVIGDSQLFGIAAKSSTWFSSIGGHWQASNTWRWSAQIDGHGGVFNSSIVELEQNAWQLAVAGERKFKGGSLQLYFSEDLVVNSSADFALGINLKFFGR